jgi:hypothetical protein
MAAMNDHELDRALKDLAAEKTTAPDVVVRKTKSSLHCTRLFPIGVFVSFGFLTICALAAIFTFIYLDIPLQARLYGIGAICTVFGALDMALIAVRSKIADLCRRMERTICHQ